MCAVPLAVAGEEEQRAGQPFLAGIEQLIHEIRFDPNVSRQDVGEEPIRECMLLVKQPGHLVLLDDEEGTRARGDGGRHADRLSRQGSLAKEVAGRQQRHDRFLARVGEDSELHAACPNIDDAIAGVTL